MTSTTQIDTPREPLPPEVIERTRASLAQLYAAAVHAEFVVNGYLNLPIVQAAITRRRAAAAARDACAASSPTSTPGTRHPPALELLSLPPERSRAVLAAMPRRHQSAVLRMVSAAAAACAHTAPGRAHELAGFILRTVRSDRLPVQAPLLRRQLAGRALLARARALVTLRAYAAALPVIAEAYAVLPRTDAYALDRIDAQLLRGQALAATGH
ncbi:MAG TPA: hypothetical protein VF909_18675, partial [Roseiflexaceae bacterium]